MWIALYCNVYVAYFVFTLCVMFFTDEFHVRLSQDIIKDLRNDINMYVYMYVYNNIRTNKFLQRIYVRKEITELRSD